tara:strand:- start:532 stop:2178 length:1647 start_codon:yes stop_codon:yes gene_type:complete
MNKKRVLFVSESHHLASGFGTYAKQVLPRLAATNKYHLAEFASYGDVNRIGDVPWDYYSNTPITEEEKNLYNSQQANAFGIWRFNRVVLDFKPDIVLTYRDPWMDEWIKESPLRKYFHWLWMPTVDSYPQKRKWLETFKSCDAVLAYSEFGEKVLDRQSGGTINTIGCASPAIDPKIYKPVQDKKKHKSSYGLPEDCFITGTVMRNQTRKLFIELMKSFRMFLDNAPKEIAEKSFLYLHTSYPEKGGWDIEDGIMSNGLSNNVLCTYVCRGCSHWEPSRYKGPVKKCSKCGQRNAFMPNVGHGISIEELINVYNLFDLYVQYAICEGFGMPQVEAACCGVPVAAVDYSAMEDVVRHTNGYPIRIKKMFRELNTNAERAYPDNEHLAEILQHHFSHDDNYRKERSSQAREGAMRRYDWDATAKVWENYIDSYKPIAEQGKWDLPIEQSDIPDEVPQGMSYEHFVKWCFAELIRSPERVNSYDAQKYLASLDFGCFIDGSYGPQLEPFNVDIMFNIFKTRAQDKNILEQLRTGVLEAAPMTFLKKGRMDD